MRSCDHAVRMLVLREVALMEGFEAYFVAKTRRNTSSQVAMRLVLPVPTIQLLLTCGQVMCPINM